MAKLEKFKIPKKKKPDDDKDNPSASLVTPAMKAHKPPEHAEKAMDQSSTSSAPSSTHGNTKTRKQRWDVKPETPPGPIRRLRQPDNEASVVFFPSPNIPQRRELSTPPTPRMLHSPPIMPYFDPRMHHHGPTMHHPGPIMPHPSPMMPYPVPMMHPHGTMMPYQGPMMSPHGPMVPPPGHPGQFQPPWPPIFHPSHPFGPQFYHPGYQQLPPTSPHPHFEVPYYVGRVTAQLSQLPPPPPTKPPYFVLDDGRKLSWLWQQYPEPPRSPDSPPPPPPPRTPPPPSSPAPAAISSLQIQEKEELEEGLEQMPHHDN